MISLHFLQTQFSFENVTQQKNFSKNFSAKIVNLKNSFLRYLYLAVIKIKKLCYFWENIFLKFTLKNIFYIFADKKNDLYGNDHRGHKIDSNRMSFRRAFYSLLNVPTFYSVLSFFCNKNFFQQKGAEI